MRKLLTAFFLVLLSSGFVNAQEICGGQSATLQAQNPLGLTNLSYSLNPGGFTSPNGQFIVSPNVTTTYTLYTSGNDANNTSTTSSAVVQVTVHPQPSAPVTVTNYACNTTTNAFNLNLTFNPGGPTPQFTITWGAPPEAPNVPNVPPTWSNNATSMSGSVAPSVYTAIITAAGGCSTSAIFTVAPPPVPADFSLAPLPNYMLTCNVSSISIAANNPTLNYTFNSAATGPLGDGSVTITYTNLGSWTVTGVNATSGCVKTQTFSVIVNTLAPTSKISPTFQTITCNSPIPQNVTLTAVNPTVNFMHVIQSQQHTTWQSTQDTAIYQPGPGSYTYCLLNLSTGCRSCEEFTVASTTGFPTFSINSVPGGFTLGCSSKSFAVINITDASTTPTMGGAVNYTLLPPGASTVLGALSTQSSFTVNVPGTYTAVVNDISNNCATRLPFSVITNTLPPAIDSVLVPQRILDCDDPTTVIEGFSSTENVQYNWSFPTSSGIGNLSSKPYTVNINQFVPPTNTLIANYTLSITENNNLCVSRTVIPMYQNLFPPQALGSSSTPSITCATPSAVITNISTSRVPTGSIFQTGQIVEAILWKGPSPQVDLPNSTTYTAYVPGEYTMTALDRNNGCTSTTIITLGDYREYPLIANSYASVPLDCGEAAASMTPMVTNSVSNMTFTWTAPVGATITPNRNAQSIAGNKIGTYTVAIQNPLSGCITIDSMRITQGVLNPSIAADKVYGFAPLTVNFINNSISTTGNSGIETTWNFENDSVMVTESASVSPSIVYTQPGTYTVTAYVRKGLCMDTAEVVIEVDTPSELKIPNVFTPNGDGINDLFFLQRSANLTEINAKIMDRWGNTVYEVTSETGNIEWDGNTMTGRPAAAGTYLIIITAKGSDGTKYDEKGTVTLIR